MPVTRCCIVHCGFLTLTTNFVFLCRQSAVFALLNMCMSLVVMTFDACKDLHALHLPQYINVLQPPRKAHLRSRVKMTPLLKRLHMFEVCAMSGPKCCNQPVFGPPCQTATGHWCGSIKSGVYCWRRPTVSRARCAAQNHCLPFQSLLNANKMSWPVIVGTRKVA